MARIDEARGHRNQSAMVSAINVAANIIAPETRQIRSLRMALAAFACCQAFQRRASSGVNSCIGVPPGRCHDEEPAEVRDAQDSCTHTVPENGGGRG